MASNGQVAMLVAALTAVQSDVNGLLDKVSDLENQLQQAQSQSQQAASPSTPTVDLSQALALATSIRQSLEGTADTVDQHVADVQQATDATNDAGSSGNAGSLTQQSLTSSADVGSSGPSVVDPTQAEQTIIGADGNAIGNGSDSNNPTATDSGNTDTSGGTAQSTSTDSSGQ